jgi:hypothetical protein
VHSEQCATDAKLICSSRCSFVFAERLPVEPNTSMGLFETFYVAMRRFFDDFFLTVDNLNIRV